MGALREQLVSGSIASGDCSCGADVDSDAFAFDATEVGSSGREAGAVSLSEIMVSKDTDCGDGLQPDDASFVFDGNGGTVDGHVQYNPFVTVDTVEGATFGDGSVRFVQNSISQTSSDPSDSFIPVEQVRPTESLLAGDGADRSTGDLALWQENYGRTPSDGTSDALAPSDFFLI